MTHAPLVYNSVHLLALCSHLNKLRQTPLLNMAFEKILVFVAASAVLSSASALPDSAGMVEMPPGLAYGGIPYGSVSGRVANYGQPEARLASGFLALTPRPVPDMILPQVSRRSLAPVTRTPGASPVQIFSHPGVVAPGVVGMIHHVGYQ